MFSPVDWIAAAGEAIQLQASRDRVEASLLC